MGLATPSRVTIRDVARVAGVSVTTVSHAFSGNGQVEAGTRERIFRVARDLRYRPNRHAQRLRTGEAHLIVLVSSMPFAIAGGVSRLGFLMEIAAVAASAALARGLALVLAPPTEARAPALDALDVDGAIVVEPVARDPHLEHFRRLGVPVVSIGRPPGRRPSVPYVDLQSGPTVGLLLEHLWAQGARRIGLVVGAERRTSHVEGEAAYRAFAEERSMPPVAVLVEEASGEAGGRVAVHDLLRQHPDVDGLCVPVDVLAVGALAALHDAGRRVPEDVVVATRYDGVRARTSTPALSAVDLHLEDVGRAAIDLLFEHLTGDTQRDSATAPLPTLVLRASSLRREPSA